MLKCPCNLDEGLSRVFQNKSPVSGAGLVYANPSRGKGLPTLTHTQRQLELTQTLATQRAYASEGPCLQEANYAV